MNMFSFSSAYHRILDRDGAEDKGADFNRSRAEGIALGVALAKARTLMQMRRAMTELIFERFFLLCPAEEILEMINDLDLLLYLITKLARAQSNEEACQFLLDALASSIGK